MVAVATIILVILVGGILVHFYPDSESGRYDQCVQQRVQVFLEKVHFPVIDAVRTCGELRDQGALAG